MLLKASVHANVAYGLRLRGQRVDGQVHDILESVGLELLARSPRTSYRRRDAACGGWRARS